MFSGIGPGSTYHLEKSSLDKVSVMVQSYVLFVVQEASMASWPSVVQSGMGAELAHGSAAPGRMCLPQGTLSQHSCMLIHDVLHGFWLSPHRAMDDCLVRTFIRSEMGRTLLAGVNQDCITSMTNSSQKQLNGGRIYSSPQEEGYSPLWWEGTAGGRSRMAQLYAVCLHLSRPGSRVRNAGA